jgi:hypothetical protein
MGSSEQFELYLDRLRISFDSSGRLQCRKCISFPTPEQKYLLRSLPCGGLRPSYSVFPKIPGVFGSSLPT